MEVPFNLASGAVKIKTSGDATLSEANSGQLPNGTSIKLAGVDAFDGGLIEVRDPKGNASRAPVFLP